MSTIKSTYLGNLRTEAEHLKSGSKIITEAPDNNHGKDEFFSPTDLFVTSYVGCALTLIGIAAQAHGFNIDGTTVETTKVMGNNPRRIVELILHFKFPHDYTDREKRLIEGAAKTCPVANSISPEMKITKTMEF
jgi:uncharacterized OsmC-like protein